MGREKNNKRIAKSVVCAVLVASLVMPAFADDSLRTTPLKSFFSRFAKEKTVNVADKKPESKDKNKSQNKFLKLFTKNGKKKNTDVKVEETPVTALKGGVVFSIDDCINIAIKNDPNIRNAEQTQKVQKSMVGQAKSGYFPSIIGGTGYNLNNTQYFSGRDNSINNNYYGLNLGVNQLIWDFGYTKAKINMSKFNFDASGFDLQNTVLNTVYDVKIAYASVLAAKANEDVYERSVRINQLNVQRTNAMYQVGLKSKIDVVNAQATLTQQKVQLVDAQNTYETSLIALNNAMFYVDAPDYSIKDTETFNFQKSYSVKNEIDVAYDRKNYNPNSTDAVIKDGAILTSGIEKRDILKTFSFKPFAMTLKEAIQKAYDNRPDLKSLELVKKADLESLKAIKRSALPAINANGTYNLARYSDYGSNGVSVYAGMNLPSGGVNAMAIKYQIEEGNAYLDIASNNIDLLKKNIYFQVQTNYVNMKKCERIIPLMSQEVQQTLENFELADGRYAVGLSNYLELQQAQTNYISAQLDFVQAVFNYNQSLYYLQKSMGLK